MVTRYLGVINAILCHYELIINNLMYLHGSGIFSSRVN